MSTCCSTLARGADLPRLPRLPCCGDFGAVPLSMPLGLMSGRPFKPFRRAISSRCSPTTRLSSVTSPSNCTTSCSSSSRDRLDSEGGTFTHRLNRRAPRRGKRKISFARSFAPATPQPGNLLILQGFASLVRPRKVPLNWPLFWPVATDPRARDGSAAENVSGFPVYLYSALLRLLLRC